VAEQRVVDYAWSAPVHARVTWSARPIVGEARRVQGDVVDLGVGGQVHPDPVEQVSVAAEQDRGELLAGAAELRPGEHRVPLRPFAPSAGASTRNVPAGRH